MKEEGKLKQEIQKLPIDTFCLIKTKKYLIPFIDNAKKDIESRIEKCKLENWKKHPMGCDVDNLIVDIYEKWVKEIFGD